MEQQLLKQWLKQAKDFEKTGSFVMGVVVILLVVCGVGTFFYQTASSRSGKTLWPSNQQVSPTPVQVEVQNIQPRIHTVKKSEGLWQIAQQYYNDGNQYLKIFEANRDKMKNPEDINEGMQLVIPD